MSAIADLTVGASPSSTVFLLLFGPRGFLGFRSGLVGSPVVWAAKIALAASTEAGMVGLMAGSGAVAVFESKRG